MKITVSILGWKDICCSCRKEIKSKEKVFMISDIAAISGSIHLCKDCIDNISKSKKKVTED